MRARLALVLIGVVVVLVAAGCGSSKKKTAAHPVTTTTAAAATTTSAATTTAATTTVAATTTATTPAAPSFASTKNCRQLASLAAQVAKSIQPTSGDLQGTISAETKTLQALANAAPSDIRGDFQTFASAFSAYGNALVKAGLKPGVAPTAAQLAQLAAAAKGLSSAKLQAAEQHLSAWAQANCGGLATTTTP